MALYFCEHILVYVFVCCSCKLLQLSCAPSHFRRLERICWWIGNNWRLGVCDFVYLHHLLVKYILPFWEMYSAILTNTFYNYDKYITVDWCVCVSWSLTRLGGQRRRRARCCHFGWLGWGEGRLGEVYSNTIIFFDKSLDGLNELFAFCICKKGRFRQWTNFFLFWKVCELNCERLRKSKTWLIFKDFLWIGFQIGAECSAAPLIRGSGSGG